MTAATVPALSLADVSKAFGGLRAVDGVSLTVAAGERRALIGPNGAGKTTLFSLISGEQKPTGGRVELFGRDVTGLAPHRRAALGLTRTYQITNLFPSLSVLDNCILAVQALSPIKLYPHRSVARYPRLGARAREVLEAVGLGAQTAERVRDLSYGEQRQLEIAMAQASSPRLMMLDEPASGLSRGERVALTEMLLALDPSITLLLIEHDMDVALRVAERVTMMHDGRVIVEGTPDEIRANQTVHDLYLGRAAGA